MEGNFTVVEITGSLSHIKVFRKISKDCHLLGTDVDCEMTQQILGDIGNALYLDKGGGKIYSHYSTYVIQSFKWTTVTVFVGFRKALLLPAPEITSLKNCRQFLQFPQSEF